MFLPGNGLDTVNDTPSIRTSAAKTIVNFIFVELNILGSNLKVKLIYQSS